jgi:hypothetical protein
MGKWDRVITLCCVDIVIALAGAVFLTASSLGMIPVAIILIFVARHFRDEDEEAGYYYEHRELERKERDRIAQSPSDNASAHAKLSELKRSEFFARADVSKCSYCGQPLRYLAKLQNRCSFCDRPISGQETLDRVGNV